MLSTGEIIDGKYRIVRLLGEGGMGAVYEGENTRIHRKVAIKVLHAGVAEQSEAVARFEREAQAAGRIGSEHIVEVLDLGTLANGERYLVMEFLEGESLSSRIRARGRLTPQELSPIAYQLLEGLAAAHAAGIIHRDLKPDNVWLMRTKSSKAEFVKLLDFGISKFNQLSGDSGFSMTRTGAVMGTPYYMAPEQAKGARDMDHRVDIYATGVILYEALTGQVPFNADTFNELLFKIVLEQPRPVEQLVPEIDAGFSAIVNKAMARDPANRFANAQEFQAALSQWASGYGPQLVASLAVHPTAPGGIPAAVPGGFGQAPPGYGSVSQGVNTNTPGVGVGANTGTWSQSGNYSGTGAPKKSHAGLFAVLGVVGLLVLGGAGYLALSLTRSTEAAASEAQRQAELAAQEREAAAQKAAAAQAEAEKARNAQLEAEAKKQQIEAERARIEAEKEALAKAAASASAAAVNTTRPRVAAAPAKPKTTAAEPPKEPPKPATTSTSSTTTSAGRKIRTSL
jgi:hypothetical protein